MKLATAALSSLLLLAQPAFPQVFGPFLQREGDVDSSSVQALARSVCVRAGARTPRQRVEAIWRFFLTDGRFVKPGYWYHIAGWAYEEPAGQLLDVNKLLNSYGFGLCYQIAPVLQAAWHSLGFESRVWFLTGHTVAEVLYDGAYHYYDSDMLGYTPVGDTGYQESPVASVHQLEQDPGILLRKLAGPTRNKPGLVEFPWYPADLQAAAIGDLAGLFSSSGDNWLFPEQRYVNAHAMNFELRPKERLTLSYHPPQTSANYLPFQFNGKRWTEVPQPVPEYGIRTGDGPKSEKDNRHWGTGRFEFEPDIPTAATTVFEIASPWVIFAAQFDLTGDLPAAADSWTLETSTDEGRSWQQAAEQSGPRSGHWTVKPQAVAQSKNGVWTVLSGRYRYLLRVKRKNHAGLTALKIITDVQLNPRSLPELSPGQNTFHVQPRPPVRHLEMPFEDARFAEFATTHRNIRHLAEEGNGMLIPQDQNAPAELMFELTAPNGAPLQSFTAGGRFLWIQNGLAPDKYTAEVRKTAWNSSPEKRPRARIEWSTSSTGEFHTIWEFDPQTTWPDGKPIDRVLRWPEVDRSASLPEGTRKVYLRYRLENMAMDSLRQSLDWNVKPVPVTLRISHNWTESGRPRTITTNIPAGRSSHTYTVQAGEAVDNQTLVFEGIRP